MAPGGTLSADKLALLRYWYRQDEPPLLDVLGRVTDAIADICKRTLPPKDQTIADMVTAKSNELRALFSELGDRLEEKLDQILDRFPETGESRPQSTSAARALPSDEDYVVDRPELAELARRLDIEHVVGIGGQGGVGKSLLAAHCARQSFAGRVLYVSLDSGSTRSRIVDLGRAIGISFDPEQSDGHVGRVIRNALSGFDGMLILDNGGGRGRGAGAAAIGRRHL